MSARKYLTERTLNALKPAAPGTRYELYDTKLPGFGVRVSDDINNKKAGRIAFISTPALAAAAAPVVAGLVSTVVALRD